MKTTRFPLKSIWLICLLEHEPTRTVCPVVVAMIAWIQTSVWYCCAFIPINVWTSSCAQNAVNPSWPFTNRGRCTPPMTPSPPSVSGSFKVLKKDKWCSCKKMFIHLRIFIVNSILTYSNSKWTRQKSRPNWLKIQMLLPFPLKIWRSFIQWLQKRLMRK